MVTLSRTLGSVKRPGTKSRQNNLADFTMALGPVKSVGTREGSRGDKDGAAVLYSPHAKG